MKKILSLLCVMLFVILAGCSAGVDEAVSKVGEFTTFNSTADVVNRVHSLCNTLYFNEKGKIGSFNNLLDIPALNFNTPGAKAVNDKIVADIGKEILDFFDTIKNDCIVKIHETEARTEIISYQWRSFNKMTVIEVDREHGVFNGASTTVSGAYYYDRETGKDLSFDEFLTKLGTSKDYLYSALSENEKAEYTVNSIKGLYPKNDSIWNVLLFNGKKDNACTVAEIKAPK